MSIKKGIYAAAMTLINKDLSVNVDATIKHSEKLIQIGCHSTIIGGSTGMMQYISPKPSWFRHGVSPAEHFAHIEMPSRSFGQRGDTQRLLAIDGSCGHGLCRSPHGGTLTPFLYGRTCLSHPCNTLAHGTSPLLQG